MQPAVMRVSPTAPRPDVSGRPGVGHACPSESLGMLCCRLLSSLLELFPRLELRASLALLRYRYVQDRGAQFASCTWCQFSNWRMVQQFCSDIPDGQVRKFRPHLLNLSKSSELHERVQIHRVDTTNTTTWGHPYRTASVPSTRHQLLQVKLTTPSCTLEAWCIFLRSACRADRQQPVEWWQRGPRSYLAARIRNNVVKRIS